MKTVRNYGILLFVAYGLLSSGDVRRKALSGVGELMKAAAGGLATSLAREADQYDTECLEAANRVSQLKLAAELATSDGERTSLNRELADTEAETVAVKAELGNVIRTARVVENTGESIVGAFAKQRGHIHPSRSELRQAIVNERLHAADLAAEVDEARRLLAEARAGSGDSEKLSRAITLIEQVNARIAMVRGGAE